MRPDAAEASEQDPGDTPIIVTVSQKSRATATRDSETDGKNASAGGGGNIAVDINSEDEDAPVQEATGGTESPPAYPNTLHGVALAKSLAKRKKKELRGKVSLGGRVRNASTPRAALPPAEGSRIRPPALDRHASLLLVRHR